MEYEEALGQAGVTADTLTADQRRGLDEQGFLLLHDVLDASSLERVRQAFERSFAAQRDAVAPLPAKESGTRHIDRLPLDEPAFDAVYEEPRVLAVIDHVLGRSFRPFGIGGRDPSPGFGLQGLHQDWMPRTPGEPYRVVTALWLLDTFTGTNGATRVVPGSHVVPRPLPKSMQAPEGGHPDQELVIAPAGSVLVFNGHLWHSGTRNASDAPRRVLQCQFVGREVVPPGQERSVPERLPAALRALHGA